MRCADGRRAGRAFRFAASHRGYPHIRDGLEQVRGNAVPQDIRVAAFLTPAIVLADVKARFN